MARFVWGVLCQRIVTDAETNSVSYIDAIEGIGAVHFPQSLPPIWVGTLWMKERDGDELEMRVVVHGPGNDELHVQQASKAVFGAFRRFRVNLMVFGGQASGPGMYRLGIEQRKGKGWIEVTSLPLEVTKVGSEDVSQATAAKRAG